MVLMNLARHSGTSVRIGLFSIGILLASLVFFSQSVLAAKVNFAPTPITLTEGQSQTITVTLDEPIICSDMSTPCQVSLAISSNMPERLSISGSPVVIPANEWSQSHSFTITAVDDGLDNGDVTPTFTKVATSNSEYYSNFSPTFALSVLDNDDAPVVSSAVDPPVTQPMLARTGLNFQVVLLKIVLLLTSSILLLSSQLARR